MTIEGSPIVVLLAILVVFPVFFVGMWCGVIALLSVMGGWSRLATVYRAEEGYVGPIWHFQTVRLGLTRYRGVLTVGANPEGLYLAVMPLFRIAHPPLWIPWNEVEIIEQAGFLGLSKAFRFVQKPEIILFMFPNLSDKLLAAREGHPV
ncbi:MAG: hypothetical protein JXA21_06095 [Anaerolineae bacterium]|nr:hypothetical protein [Anaerolineae bacterium]